ncbi:GHMP kinase [Histomonas meleagridis]|uniref:GHMP kinase n=1 Tax=Histomonas meleagridis TaxID=135588 RepID=UPI00355A5426|nr:GHMP kinase [Histomonas meleagridis]KAH0797492.1 GHMP kinase [Histomonas meleagridis]
MKTKSFAPGRVCLLGDKSDLLNRPVIAAAITKFFHFEFTPRNDSLIKFNFPQNNLYFQRDFYSNDKKDEFFKFFSQIAWRLKDKIAPFECTVKGDLPIGSGLSSSAACSIGFLSGLNKMFNLGMNPRSISEFAYQVEHFDFGIMCGRMDQYSIGYGGVTFIETGNETKVTKIPIKEIPLVIGNSNEPRQAQHVLNKTMELLNQNDPHFHACFNMIHENVMNGYKALMRNDLAELGARMSIHQGLERAMGATTSKLDAMCDAAISAGALGAKQIGAGGGGCMIALCPGNMDKVMEAIRKCGATVWKANIHPNRVVC